MSRLVLARSVLAVALVVAAGFVANRARYVGPDYAAVDLPVQFQTGFLIKHSFQAKANAQLCFTLQRSAPKELDMRDTFDPDGVVADFQITANGATVVQGPYPPHTALWRSWSARDEYRAFGSFRTVAGEQYELQFHIVEAPSSSTIKSGRLKIMVDRFETGRAKILELFVGVLLIAALLVSLSLLRRIPGRGGVTGES